MWQPPEQDLPPDGGCRNAACTITRAASAPDTGDPHTMYFTRMSLPIAEPAYGPP
jgi:hypothetical protein